MAFEHREPSSVNDINIPATISSASEGIKKQLTKRTKKSTKQSLSGIVYATYSNWPRNI